MSFLGYKPGPVEYWLWAALTEFINGFLSGWRSGLIGGTGTVTVTGTTAVADNITAMQQLWIGLSAGLLGMAGNGWAQFSKWHESGHPFPNPYPAQPSAPLVPPPASPP